MKEALPQIVFIIVLVLNLGTALLDHDRNVKASLISTSILVAITYWGDFYAPLINLIKGAQG